MKPLATPLILVALLLLGAAACSHLLPDYSAQIAEQQAAIAAVEQERASVEADLTALKEQLATAPPEVAPELAATIDALAQMRTALKDRKDELEEGMQDYKTGAAGQATGKALELLMYLLGALGLGGTAIGAKLLSVAAVVKSGPSRAQGQVDELWEKLASYRLEAERRLAQLEQGMAAAGTPTVASKPLAPAVAPSA